MNLRKRGQVGLDRERVYLGRGGSINKKPPCGGGHNKRFSFLERFSSEQGMARNEAEGSKQWRHVHAMLISQNLQTQTAGSCSSEVALATSLK